MMKLIWFPVPNDAPAVLVHDNGYTVNGVIDEFQGVACQYFDLPDDLPTGNGATITVSKPGYVPDYFRGVLWKKPQTTNNEFPFFPGQEAALVVDSNTLQRNPFPVNPPSREEVLSGTMHFRGGLECDSPTYGKMPIWPAALSMLDYVTREMWYDEFRKAGDTHCIIHIQDGPVRRGDPRNYYANPDKFHSFDWTNGLTGMDPILSKLINEVIANGFKFIITMNETESISLQIIQLAMNALTSEQVKFGFFLPGYDGVFYGWPNDQVSIPDWARRARAIHPECYLGIEHNFGHIPLGEGGEDYAPGGKMEGFDVILSEFPTAWPRPTYNPEAPPDQNADSIWQIAPRLNRPYNRPPEQPSWDDPNPPFYLIDSPRGKRYAWFFETWQPYWYVRTDPYNQAAMDYQKNWIEQERIYAREIGYGNIG